jgi:uncharacterized membrane protein YhaH (DUF805 family)
MMFCVIRIHISHLFIYLFFKFTLNSTSLIIFHLFLKSILGTNEKGKSPSLIKKYIYSMHQTIKVYI